jgi:hypothetical protein
LRDCMEGMRRRRSFSVRRAGAEQAGLKELRN